MKNDRYRMGTKNWMGLRLGAAALIVAATVPDAFAATIQLHQDAATAVVARRLFTDHGRRVLTGDPASCTYAYLEQPAVAFRDGRLILRVRLAGRAGLRVNGSCVGAGDAFYTTVSGQPYVAGETIALRDMRLEEGKPEYRQLVESLLQQQVRALLGLNLRDELNKLAQSNASELRMTLTQFKLIDIAARDALLAVRFDFALQAIKP
ncbi:MAG: hypothetical protein ABI667_07910 [Sphingomicrobium sp.]